MYQYLGFIVVILGIIYFTFFINRMLRSILNIHTIPLTVIIIGLIVSVLSFPAVNILGLYGVIYCHLLIITLVLELFNYWLKKYYLYRFTFTSGILSLIITCLILIN